VARHGDSARGFYERINAYIKAGQREEAADDFKQVLSMTEEEDVIQRARRALKDPKDADYR